MTKVSLQALIKRVRDGNEYRPDAMFDFDDKYQKRVGGRPHGNRESIQKILGYDSALARSKTIIVKFDKSNDAKRLSVPEGFADVIDDYEGDTWVCGETKEGRVCLVATFKSVTGAKD